MLVLSFLYRSKVKIQRKPPQEKKEQQSILPATWATLAGSKPGGLRQVWGPRNTSGDAAIASRPATEAGRPR